jgi:hypothetical protein
MAEGKEDSGDVLKFFIGVMTLLTMFIAGYAGFTWSQVGNLADQVEADQKSLDKLVVMAADPEFRMALAKQAAQARNGPVNTTDLQRFLIESAEKLSFKLRAVDPMPGSSFGPQTFLRRAYKLSIEKQSMEVIADYLFYVQATWPGLKIEELLVHPAPKPNKDAAWQGWNAEIVVSTYKPKDQPPAAAPAGAPQ